MSSVSVENYLKAIFTLEQQLSGEEERVKSKDIAGELSIAQPSVTSMLKTLAAQSLIDYQPYQGVRLTASGRAAALGVIRRHRLTEVFLIEALGLSWDEVHVEAERLEHALSDKVTDRLEAFLGYPTHDPHGDPIPDRAGRLPEVGGVPLVNVSAGESVRVVRVLDQSPEFLRYLNEQGLVPGTGLDVREVAPFDGPLTIEVQGRSFAVSRSLARRIVVVSVTGGSGA